MPNVGVMVSGKINELLGQLVLQNLLEKGSGAFISAMVKRNRKVEDVTG
jgi:hypothetical protein